MQADQLVVGAELDVALEAEAGSGLAGPVDRGTVGGDRHFGLAAGESTVSEELVGLRPGRMHR